MVLKSRAEKSLLTNLLKDQTEEVISEVATMTAEAVVATGEIITGKYY